MRVRALGRRTGGSKQQVRGGPSCLFVLLAAACSAPPVPPPPPDRNDGAYVECAEPRPEVCTQHFDPVCAQRDTGIRCITHPCEATEWQQYGNACTACADTRVYGYRAGACAADTMRPEE